MLKQYNSIPDTQIAPTKRDQQYNTYPGRVVFEQLSLTGLNRLPVNVHRDAATAGATLSGADRRFTELVPPAVAEGMLVDGGVLAVWEPLNGLWEIQGDIVSMTRDEIVQDVTPKSEQFGAYVWYRKYVRLPDESWIVNLHKTSIGFSAQDEIIESVTLPANTVAYQYFGRDVLAPNQWTFWRLEEIKWAIQRESTEFALSIIITGELGRDPQDAINKLSQGKRIAGIQGRNTNAIRVSDTSVIDKLGNEYDSLRGDYMNSVYLFDISNQPNRPVGIDLKLRYVPQTRYLETLRDAIAEFYMPFTGLSYTYEAEQNAEELIENDTV